MSDSFNSNYDTGLNEEDYRLFAIEAITVTEGEDKPLKDPTIFNSADVAIVTKLDLAEAVEYDRHAAYGNIQSVRPRMQVLALSAKSRVGMDGFLTF